MPPLMELRNARKVFGSGIRTTVALETFSLSITGDVPVFVTVAGESGSGKTTLARLLLGFIQPTAGKVLYRGKNVAQLSKQEKLNFRRDVQAIFQDPFEVFNPFYTVDHLLNVAIEKFSLARSREDARQKIEQALQGVGLRPEDTLGRYPHQLSGGQRQRLTIARALLVRPRLIVADEPVSMVDASLRATILESLQKLHVELGISFVYITHDLTTAYQISDTIVVMYRGSVAEAGDVELVIQHPRHPYSQLLVSSIPEPDVEHRWADEDTPPAIEAGAVATQGCQFAERCPHVMPMCREDAPPLYQTDQARAASCFLYREAPVVVVGQLDRVLAAASIRQRAVS
jgi:peptide/nickel transport system ATP-binding protein